MHLSAGLASRMSCCKLQRVPHGQNHGLFLIIRLRRARLTVVAADHNNYNTAFSSSTNQLGSWLYDFTFVGKQCRSITLTQLCSGPENLLT